VLGKGVFGLVLLAKESLGGGTVAIKVMREGDSRVREQAKREIEILRLLNAVDHEQGFIVRMRDQFKFSKRLAGESNPTNFICIVFEPLEMSLRDLLHRETDETGCPVGLTLDLVRIVAWQMLVALSLLALPSINVIHCDVKPENIMLKGLGKPVVKLIDFGNASFGNKEVPKYIQSRAYRAPEVLLGEKIGPEIDVWSLGCVLYELHFGEVLFLAERSEDQLARIEEVKRAPARGQTGPTDFREVLREHAIAHFKEQYTTNKVSP
jgi:serine/threonine protein kinase